MSHPLSHTYTFYHKRNPINSTVEAFELSLIKLGNFSTIEEFYSIYSYLIIPSECGLKSEYLLFKNNIKPMWEDSENINGGKWMIRFKKGSSSKSWENLILALIGNQFGNSATDEICGVLVSLKQHEDVLSIWNKNSNNKDAIYRIRDVLKEVLDIPVNVAFEYKPHQIALNALQKHEKQEQEKTDA